MMSRYVVTETITIQKTVEAESKDNARDVAYMELPNYEKAGWDLIDSLGPNVTTEDE